MGTRAIVPVGLDVEAPSAAVSRYDDLRIELGIAELGKDFGPGEAFPHDVNWDLTGAVSFRKGCFIGQEVVSRMQHKAVVRKRIVRIGCEAGGTSQPLAGGTDMTTGPATIGAVGSVHSDGRRALAMVRLDRAAEAIDKGDTILAGDTPVVVDPDALSRYREAASKRETAT